MADPCRILTPLETGKGECFIDLSEIVGISSPVENAKFGRSRRIALAGGAVEYIRSNEANLARLRHLLPADYVVAWTVVDAPQGVKGGKDARKGSRKRSAPPAGA